MQHFKLFNHCWFIRMLVIAVRCPRQWSEDFMTSSNAFHVFYRFADLESYVCWILTVGQHFKSIANKSNSQELPFLYFLQYDPKEVRVLKKKKKFFFWIFWLADYQKSFNAVCNNIFLHICAVIMNFFIILKC